MLIATSLVMLMTPGLAFFYGGLVGRKNVLTIMIQSFVSMAIVDILWFTVGFSLSFSGGAGGVYGDFHYAFMQNMGPGTPFAGDPSIPLYAFFVYQMMFAIITPALISGAFTNRVSFKAYIIFLVAWSLFVYIPFVHMIWGGGLLATWGVRDFAGGIVVHTLAGFAALAAVFFVGARRIKDSAPHNVPLVALGTGLLWFGWYGFNAGSELTVDTVTVTAFINTDLAASVAATVWLAMAWIFEKKPKFLGLLTGAVAGLAMITPCAGYISPGASMVVGVLAGTVCYGAIWLKNRRGWDDALDVWGVHGIGGAVGAIALGVFANAAFNHPGVGPNGLLLGDTHFFAAQVA
ncbi:MAG: ammonium transporter, partial [Euryarchaeota archaeon]|nr:ammonium transporter [Euryarchaeota archaeon]